MSATDGTHGESHDCHSKTLSRRTFLRYAANSLHLAIPVAIIGGVNLSVDNAQKLRTSIPGEIDGVLLTKDEHNLLLDLMRYGKHYVDVNAQIDRPRVWSALIRSGAWSNVRHLFQGSSLGMPVRAEHLGYREHEFGNLSLFAAGLCDHIGGYFHIRQEGLRPTSVMLEIAPWTLTTGTSTQKHDFIATAKNGMQQIGLLDMKEFQELSFVKPTIRASGTAHPAEIVQRLRGCFDNATVMFSIPYWRENVSYLISQRVDGDRIKNMFDRTMSLAWSEIATSQPDSSICAAIARKTMRVVVQEEGDDRRMNEYFSTPIQDHFVHVLETLVDWYQRDGVEVSFYLPSLHEYFVELQQKLAEESGRPFLLELTTAFMLKFARDRKLKLFGRRSRAKPGGHFIDESHQSQIGVAQDVSQVLYAPNPD